MGRPSGQPFIEHQMSPVSSVADTPAGQSNTHGENIRCASVHDERLIAEESNYDKQSSTLRKLRDILYC
jgi:hypothetical protein